MIGRYAEGYLNPNLNMRGGGDLEAHFIFFMKNHTTLWSILFKMLQTNTTSNIGTLYSNTMHLYNLAFLIILKIVSNSANTQARYVEHCLFKWVCYGRPNYCAETETNRSREIRWKMRGNNIKRILFWHSTNRV